MSFKRFVPGGCMWDVICEFVVQLIELRPVMCGEDFEARRA